MSSLRIVSLPIWKQQLGAKIQRFFDKNEGATFEGLREAFPDIAEKDLRELSQTKYLTYYIEDMGDDPSFEINPIEEEVDRSMDQAKIDAYISDLPEPHSSVIRLSFGFGDGVELQHREVAEMLGMSKDALRKVKKEAMEMLKEAMGPVNPFN